VDVIAGYNVVLTLEQIQQIFFATTGSDGAITTGSIHAGDPAHDPFALASTLPDSTDAPVGQVAASDGTGGTTMVYPTHGVYVGGA
jgi:hypothetical protein